MLEQYKLEGNLLIEGFDPSVAEKAKEHKKALNEPFWKLVMASRQSQEILQAACEGFEQKEYKKGTPAEWCAVVKIGEVMGYIPLSMLETTEKAMRGLSGQKVAFVVTAINNEQEYFVASRKQALKHMADIALKRLRIGDTITGVIRQTFVSNVLVDVGGIVASIPVGEITYGWIDDLRDFYEKGQHIDVKITGINREERKVTASVKALLPDPFETAIKNFKEGGEYVGHVSGVVRYGYFISLAEGVNGLAPLKNMALNKGDQVLCRFGKVDVEKREINLKVVKKI